MKNLTLTIGLILLSIMSFGQKSSKIESFVDKAIKDKYIVKDTSEDNRFLLPKNGIVFSILEDRIVLTKKNQKLVISYEEIYADTVVNGPSVIENFFFYVSEGDEESVLYKRNETCEGRTKTTYRFKEDNTTYSFINFFPNGTPYKD